MEKYVLALGFFDGVHIGHGALLHKTNKRAEALGALPGVITFDRHPRAHTGGQEVPLIGTSQMRKKLIAQKFGINMVEEIVFDESFRKMPPGEFIDFLEKTYAPLHLVCGHDFRFGYQGEGNPELLAQACKRRGIGLDIIEEARLEGVLVSSTHIRQLLQEGDMQEAARFLGHYYPLCQVVEPGQKLGAKLNTPTINMRYPQGLIALPRGVYLSRVLLEKPYPAITNIGRRPTVEAGDEIWVETHILDYDACLYGKELCVELEDYIRPEQKFLSIEELKGQIGKDIENARNYFGKQM